MPEKSLSQIPAATRELYDKGVAALQKNNFDYAVALFGQALRVEPGFYDCREALRAAQHKRGAGRSTGLFRKFLGSASSLTKGQLALRSNPVEALVVAEEILNDDPGSEAAHLLVADAALAAGLPRTAILSLEIAFRNNPRDRRLADRLAGTLAELGQRGRAEKLYRDLLVTDPHDAALNEKLKNLLANRTLNETGYQAVAEGTGSYRDLLKDRQEAVTLEQENRTVKDADVAAKLIAEYESRLAVEPRDLKLLRDVAELHERRGDFPAAIATYERLLAVAGIADPVILKAIQEARLSAFDQQEAAIDGAAPDAEARRAAIRAERQNFLIEDVQRRASANPTDLHIRFELAQIYFQANRLTEAIGELQKAQNNPNRRIPAMALLAQCFARRGMNDLAARKLQEALKEKLVFDDEKKDLHYTLGSILEKIGRAGEAIEQFKTIYEIDIAYRDVAAKVDAYYAAQG